MKIVHILLTFTLIFSQIYVTEKNITGKKEIEIYLQDGKEIKITHPKNEKGISEKNLKHPKQFDKEKNNKEKE